MFANEQEKSGVRDEVHQRIAKAQAALRGWRLSEAKFLLRSVLRDLEDPETRRAWK